MAGVRSNLPARSSLERGRSSQSRPLQQPAIGAEGLLETSVPRVYATGDVRAGSIKRCAIAVSEGAAVVLFVHEHLEPSPIKD